MKFQDKTAIITGGAVGIGRAIALQLARGGADVVILDVNEDTLKETEQELLALGGKVMARICDVSDEARVHEIAQEVQDTFGKIDILVNNAGIWRESSGMGPFVDSDSANWRRKININILGTMYFTQAVLPGMCERRYGKVVNISSVAGYYGIKTMVDYSMTKGAINAFTLALAKEVAPYGVNVNAVSPGNINTSSNPDANNTALSYMNRSGSPEECANVVCFLASDDAGFVSGQNYIVDGCRKSI